VAEHPNPIGVDGSLAPQECGRGEYVVRGVTVVDAGTGAMAALIEPERNDSMPR
jgi:hypothetical protein